MNSKKKLCSICGKESYLFKSNPNICTYCYRAKPIKKVSIKHKETLDEYKILRDKFLKDKIYCEICLPGCTKYIEGLHHRGGKATKQLYLDSTLWVACCNHCNLAIELIGIEAYEKGYKIHKHQINEN